jgi:hypothetical protein
VQKEVANAVIEASLLMIKFLDGKKTRLLILRKSEGIFSLRRVRSYSPRAHLYKKGIAKAAGKLRLLYFHLRRLHSQS